MKSFLVKMVLFIVSFFLVSVSLGVAADANQDLYKGIFKIKTYERNGISGHYSFSHYGSAVLIEKNRIITNAHVILDADGVSPTGYYEVCKSTDTQKMPICFTAAKLVSYDVVADIAVLELTSPATDIKSVTLSDAKTLPMSSNVVVYGYPAIGGYSITRTEGKIGGMDGDKYKFDGTIDHGNSGGGAFGTDGKLIGIPYAVKSDNGMIGYIIPVSLVRDFLAAKTDAIQKYTKKVEPDFFKYIRDSEALYKNPNLIKTKYVEIKNAEKSGFNLVNTVASSSGDIFLYQFLDKNNSVIVSVGCTKDASKTWTSAINYQNDMISLPDENPKTSISTGYIDSKKNAYMTEYIDIKETKGEKSAATIIVYSTAPRCASFIAAGDIKNKDKTSYQKGVAFLKTIKFLDAARTLPSFSSSFFNFKDIPKNVMFSEGSSLIRGGDIVPLIGVVFPGQYSTSSSFQMIKFDDMDGYMNYEYSDSNQYKGKDYSFQAFFDRYKTSGYSNVRDTEITTKDGKKIVMTTKSYDNTTGSSQKYEQELVFFYPFVKDGKYYAYRFDFTLYTPPDSMDVYAVRDIIIALELPGTSPFKK